MQKALKIIVSFQIVLGAFWTLYLIPVERTDLAHLFLFFYIYPFHLIFFLVGAWAFFRHKTLRKLAGCVMALPFLFLFLPGSIRGIAGGPVDADSAVLMTLVLAVSALIYAVVRPEKVTQWIPGFFYRSRGWNIFVVLLQLVGWAAPVIVLAVIVSEAPSRPSGSGMGLAVLMMMVATYLVTLGIWSSITSVHAWLGLRGGVEDASRRLHITQLVLGIPGILLGGVVLGLVLAQH